VEALPIYITKGEGAPPREKENVHLRAGGGVSSSSLKGGGSEEVSHEFKIKDLGREQRISGRKKKFRRVPARVDARRYPHS